MKKVTFIAVSCLVLAAATVAAKTSDHSTDFHHPEAETASPSGEDSLKNRMASQQIRRVAAPEVEFNSCGKASWPYYPVECLQRVDMADL
ncbi:hypothetical protein PZ897_00940 [Hoeflea sp. YIM 152468]|uniref:hypothetical protein n=1 Tax=Hoeflea sp. YIM 152468 TaxID=3031759 RepID=UPI0023DBB7DA|nr:hypothetical protein [Hoeflea sp. YIM 152468]MDF1606733.1 hypothetical protein [Hoeflea sp. YIM 152468]